jgi:hypothetical protein
VLTFPTRYVAARCPCCPVSKPSFVTDLGENTIVRTTPRRQRYLSHLAQVHPLLSPRLRSLIADDMIRTEVALGTPTEAGGEPA